MPHWNAVPAGTNFNIDTEKGCEDKCSNTTGCYQWTWNYGHKPRYSCFVSTSKTWGGRENGHITSGCVADKVEGCGKVPPPPPPPSPPTPGAYTPHWAVHGAPDSEQPFCGFKMLGSTDGVVTTMVYKATPEIGAYNHAAMMDWHNGSIFLSWKNSPVGEDTPGQRVLFSQSRDGIAWTPTDGVTNVLFPNMSSTAKPAALFGGKSKPDLESA